MHLLPAAIAALALAVAVADDASGATPARPGAGLASVQGKLSFWPIPNPATPRDPAAAADGTIYFAQAGSDRIVRFDPETARFQDWPVPAGTRPHGIVVLADRKILFGGNGSRMLGLLDPATAAVRPFPLTGPDARPYSVVADGSTGAWVAARAGGIAHLRLDRGTVEERAVAGDAYDVAVDRTGAVWITRIAADRVTKLDPRSGGSEDVVLAPGAKPRRVNVGPDGSIWVTLYGAGKLARIDPASARVVRDYPMPGGGNAGPYSVSPDALGRIWVTEFQANAVAILDPAAETFRVIRLPERDCGVRNATIDRRGRFWFICSTSGKLGMIE